MPHEQAYFYPEDSPEFDAPSFLFQRPPYIFRRSRARFRRSRGMSGMSVIFVEKPAYKQKHHHR